MYVAIFVILYCFNVHEHMYTNICTHRIFESFTHVRKQLQCLWQPYFVDGLFSQLLSLKFDEISRKGIRICQYV